jgi:hypothetical protein
LSSSAEERDIVSATDSDDSDDPDSWGAISPAEQQLVENLTAAFESTLAEFDKSGTENFYIDDDEMPRLSGAHAGLPHAKFPFSVCCWQAVLGESSRLRKEFDRRVGLQQSDNWWRT